MLQSMRQLAHSWLFKGLMTLLVISFGIWGVGDMFRSNPLQREAATVGKESISVQAVNQAFSQALARARQMFGPEVTAQQAKQMGMVDNALNGLVEQSLVDQDVKRLGLDADDRAVMDELMQEPSLKGKDGTFDKSLLKNYLTQSHINERAFLDGQRKQLAIRQLVAGVTTLPPLPKSVTEKLYAARAQKRVLDVVTLDNASLSVETPDEKTLRDFHQKNPKPFTAQEVRSLTIAILASENLAKDITISDDQLRAEYDAKGDQLVEPEKRDLLQVILQDETKAKELAAAAKASGNLVSAAKPYGKQVVPLNGTEEANLPPELAKPVFALKANDVSAPIKTGLGWHVLQLRKIHPAAKPDFAAIKDSLRERMKRDQAIDSITKTVNRMDDELAAGHALEDMADDMRLRLIKVAAVDATGKTPDGKDPAELPHKEDILKAAFGQNSGETSPVMDDRNGTYYAVRTDNVTPSALKPFEQVKADVIAAWKAKEQSIRAAAEAENIAKTLRDGKAASSLASRKGIEVRQSKPVSQLGDSDPALPRTALPEIFKLKKGEVTVVAESGKQLILRLATLIDADTKDESGHDKIRNEINADAPKEIAEQYLRYLRTLYPVRIHQDALDSVAQQGG